MKGYEKETAAFAIELAEDYGKATAALLSAVEAGEALCNQLENLVSSDDSFLRLWSASIGRQRAIYEELREKREASMQRALERLDEALGRLQ